PGNGMRLPAALGRLWMVPGRHRVTSSDQEKWLLTCGVSIAGQVGQHPHEGRGWSAKPKRSAMLRGCPAGGHRECRGLSRLRNPPDGGPARGPHLLHVALGKDGAPWTATDRAVGL